MLRMHQSSSASDAVRYYNDALSRESGTYYTHDSPGQWGGMASQYLSLSGNVPREDFAALAHNQRPGTGQRLTVRNAANRRAGYDLVFNAPKSVSLLYAMTQDKRIHSAFELSVHDTMAQIEADTQTRVTHEGQKSTRVTGNMVWAGFTHYTARPEQGHADPHLHRHCYVFNATYDFAEQRFKAIDFANLKRDMPYYQAIFHSKLAHRLREQGFAIEQRPRSWQWDVAGISRSTLEKFSRRTDRIEQEAKKRGLTSAEQKSELGAKTRSHKSEDKSSWAELRRVWYRRLSHSERETLGAVLHRAKGVRTGSATALSSDAEGRYRKSQAAVRHALDHCLANASVTSERRVLAETLQHRLGEVTLGQAKHALARRPDVLTCEHKGERLLTTKGVQQQEREIIEFARRGRGACRSLAAPDYRIRDSLLVINESSGQRLNDQQQIAVHHVLTCPDRVIAIRGGAGVGKTSMMKAAIQGLRENGHRVYTFAPSADAGRGVLREKGFARANTVQHLLTNKQLQDEVRGQVIWVDEAGQLSVRQTHQLFRLAQEKQTRIILSGDYHQHAPVDRGDAFRLLDQRAGIRTAHISHIVRQQGDYKAAIGCLQHGDVSGGFEKLQRMGAIHEIPDQSQRDQKVAADYCQTVRAGQTALVVSPTHAEGERISGLIRDRLRDEKRLRGSEQVVPRLQSYRLSAAQKASSRNYQIGDVVQFDQNCKGFRRGHRSPVLLVEQEKVWVFNSKRELASLPLDRSGHFDVYRSDSIGLAAGDKIRITKNGFTHDKQHRLNNGAMHQVQGFTSKGHVKLDNGFVVNKDYGHWKHGYVSTSHSSQGKDVDRVIIAQSSQSLPAASKEQFYVSASRGKRSLAIYTDDKQDLRQSVERTSHRMAAIELTKARSAMAVRTLQAARFRQRHKAPQPAPVRHDAPQPTRPISPARTRQPTLAPAASSGSTPSAQPAPTQQARQPRARS